MFRPGTCLLGGLSGMAAVALCLLALSTFPGQPGTAVAVSWSDDGVWTTYTTAHGLPSNTVWGGVAVDDGGRLWAGFENGQWSDEDPLPLNELVSRLNGDTWFNYELRGCRVLPLVAAEEVYAGTYCPGPPSGAGGGLSWFFEDPGVEDTWVTFASTDGMAGSYVRAVAPEGESRVWVSSGYNLHCCFNHVNLLDHRGTVTKADDEWTVYDLGPTNVDAIAIGPDGNRWFGTSGEGVRVLSADGSSWITYTSAVISGANDIAFDAMGNTWFARGGEVTRFNGVIWTDYDSREEAIEANYEAIMTSLNRNEVQGILSPGLWAIEEPAGVWIIREIIGEPQEGVGFYDGSTWTIYDYENSPLDSTQIFGIAVDQQRNVWFGTQKSYPNSEGGLHKFMPWPDFSLDATPGALLIEPGQVATIDVAVSRLRGWVPTATLSILSLPPATSATFSANPVTPTAQVWLTITTTLATPLGIYPLTVMATGADITRTTTITLGVVAEVYRDYFPIANKVQTPQVLPSGHSRGSQVTSQCFLLS